jgi:carotenoid cleavage dioxygenase-like enzyme
VVDLPTINPKIRGRQYCYVYAWAPFAAGSRFENIAIVKKNVCTNATALVWSRPNHLASESIFVPRTSGDDKDGVEEDDGVLLNAMYDGDRGENYLLVLDARSLEQVAAVYTRPSPDGQQHPPHLMGFGIHGRFFPAAADQGC